ncbi:MAG: glycosyl transferase family 1 [Anaerolineae bacterium]|nr:MAG: glycosyl transferase family 1 [Anaerolineae bacterium]WKZ43896.1 MAG: glycosyltransferase [Anaerolineales bacterium]
MRQDKNKKGRVLFVGHSYYNTWYLSRGLRELGWKADTLNIDTDETQLMYYHGQDYQFRARNISDLLRQFVFYLKAIFKYDIFHFSGAWNMVFVPDLYDVIRFFFPGLLKDNTWRWDVRLLKLLGKKIVYSNNGCLDGVLQSSFRTWGPEPVCDICPWQNRPEICSDERNRAWGRLRNSLADYQILLGGNRKDFNEASTVHEAPEFYCLDSRLWQADMLIPSNYRLSIPDDVVKIYHAVGEFESRTHAISNRNIKSTHLYIPLVERLKKEGYKVELIFFNDVPNKKLRYYQAQADIFVDMLTFGFFGANIREGLMLGKPTVCYLRPEWLESMRREIPEYVDELPVISATPATIYDILKDLIANPAKRAEIGRRSREFAVKWHSGEAAARRFDRIYSDLLGRGRSL